MGLFADCFFVLSASEDSHAEYAHTNTYAHTDIFSHIRIPEATWCVCCEPGALEKLPAAASWEVIIKLNTEEAVAVNKCVIVDSQCIV